MPALPQNNSAQGYRFPTNSMYEADPPGMQTLLFNILMVLLAVATLVVACIHFAHQRRRDQLGQDQHSMLRCSGASCLSYAHDDHIAEPISSPFEVHDAHIHASARADSSTTTATTLAPPDEDVEMNKVNPAAGWSQDEDSFVVMSQDNAGPSGS
ncbi:hypothetical protein BU23DRAFT_316566 [Bimuria novae-zelandiae CBS 107.79]|uniref:Uncharacterized protein n=1 Tax=Bimuria novae-zelandiae CBS 107.79 TaxID=1447943 RepID=A0A6A5UQ70_9PLEO|nr:hypothetical protein BU23DRAFT_316566 [Bimuria novae-zelandiae CBS 107.79]